MENVSWMATLQWRRGGVAAWRHGGVVASNSSYSMLNSFLTAILQWQWDGKPLTIERLRWQWDSELLNNDY
jgi:hypothetical protein